MAPLVPILDVDRDGQRFLLVSKSADSLDTPLTVMINWPAALKK